MVLFDEKTITDCAVRSGFYEDIPFGTGYTDYLYGKAIKQIVKFLKQKKDQIVYVLEIRNGEIIDHEINKNFLEKLDDLYFDRIEIDNDKIKMTGDTEILIKFKPDTDFVFKSVGFNFDELYEIAEEIGLKNVVV